MDDGVVADLPGWSLVRSDEFDGAAGSPVDPTRLYDLAPHPARSAISGAPRAVVGWKQAWWDRAGCVRRSGTSASAWSYYSIDSPGKS
jgi:hypothetical protein